MVIAALFVIAKPTAMRKQQQKTRNNIKLSIGYWLNQLSHNLIFKTIKIEVELYELT